MSIQTTCGCGARFKAKLELSGKRVKCPACGEPLKIPARENTEPAKSGQPIRAQCSCGKLFQANPSLAGRRVTCPECQQAFVVPNQQNASTSATSPALSSPVDDPLGLGNLGAAHDPLGSVPPGAKTLAPSRTLPKQSASSTRNKTGKSKRKKRGDSLQAIDIAAGVLAIYHGGSALLRSLFVVTMMLKLSATVGPRAFLSLGMLLFLIGLAISAGILAGGIGLLTRQPWGLQVGMQASYGYFILLGVSFVMGIVAMLSLMGSNAGGIGLLGLLWTIPRVALDAAGPALLIYLGQQRLA